MVHGEDNPTLDIGLCGWSDGSDAVTPANTTSADNVTSSVLMHWTGTGGTSISQSIMATLSELVSVLWADDVIPTAAPLKVRVIYSHIMLA